MSLGLSDTIKILRKDIKLVRNDNNIAMFFNYRKYVDINKVCNNIIDQDSDYLFYALDLFSKKHYKYRDTLYKNLEDVKVIKSKTRKRQGSYQLLWDTNSLEIVDEKASYHEVLHMASSLYDKEDDILYSGLSYDDGKNCIGEGITEGYIELLCDRDERDGKSIPKIFDDGTYAIEYEYVKQLARQLEIIIGKEKLEEIFFCGGTISLLGELEKLGKSKEEVIKFLNNCDISVVAEKYPIKLFEKKVLEAQEFLYTICLEKYPERISEFEYEMFENTKTKTGLMCDRYREEFIKRVEENDDIIKR